MAREGQLGGFSRVYVLACVGLLALCALFVASGTAVIQSCSTSATLSGSDFEIDAIVPPAAGAKRNANPTGGANLNVNGGGSCIDWKSVADSKQPDGTTGSNDNSFGQGTSENDAVPTIVSDSIPPNKSDLLNFGVYEEHASTKTFVALYWARINSPSGTTNMDFEINKNSCATPSDPGCSSNGVTPARLQGDKLVIFNLSSGGTVVDILLRTWNGSAWADEEVLNATGKAIGSINYDALPTAADNDDLGPLSALTFGEVIVDFQALLGSNQTCGSFGSVYLKSRSSDSFSAEMKDFIAPKPVNLTNCASISTQASGPVNVGQSITDTATLSNVGSGAGGTITFNLYAPGDTTCSTSIFSSTKTVSGAGNYTSSAYTTTQVGVYRWIASYSGDSGNSPVSGACNDANEASTVNKVSPTISTSAAQSVTIGASISDSATLTGGASPTGTITFNLYGPGDTTCTGTVLYTTTATVNGNGTYGPASFTPTAVGTYRWIASYGGDSNNNAVSGACNDTGENDVVGKASPGISTSAAQSVTIGASISDSATLTGGASPTGTITFNLYGPGDTTCTGTVLYTTTATVNGNGTYGPASFTPTAVGTYRWIASYGGDSNNNAVSGACNDTGENDVVGKASSTIGTSQTIYLQDSATVSAGAGGTPTGSVTFELYGPGDLTCASAPVYTETKTLSGGSASTTNTGYSVTSASASTYRWKVVYGGDGSHDGSTSACGTEKSTLTIDNG